ncbi:MAG: hypothetical protein LBP28_07340, partial [Coriobacteriales bacterium]|nr:hypothetical protein [Coriobacteriales bacterium]
SKEKECPEIRIFYKIANDSTKSFAWGIQARFVNGKDIAQADGHYRISDLIANRQFSNISSKLTIPAADFGLAVIQTYDGKYQVDNSIAYTISGDLCDPLEREIVLGAFSLTIPANFPEGAFRTDDKWVIY